MRIGLAGSVSIRAGDAVIDERRLGRQGRLLLAYLAINRGRAVPREELADLLWPAGPPAAWEKTLAAAVSRLRAALTEDGIASQDLIVGAFGCYSLHLPDGASVDLFDAEHAVVEAEERLLSGDADGAVSLARDVESIATAPLLPGEQADWVESRRGLHRELRIRALEVLAAAHAGSRESIAAAERIVEIDALRETGHQLVMRAHAAAGDRAAALQAFERCRRMLADELGVDPSPQTEAVYLEILRAQSPPEPADLAGAATIEIRTASASRAAALTGTRMTIGKSPANDVVLDEPGVSRLHALLERLGAGWTIRDLGSRNGTFVNGDPLAAERALRDGDRVAVGGATMVFRSGSPDEAETATGVEPGVSLSDQQRSFLQALCKPLLDGDPLAAATPLGLAAEEAGIDLDDAAGMVAELCDRLGIPEAAPARLALVAVQRGIAVRH